MADTIAVQVCYAKPDSTILRELQVAAGTTLEQAVRQSGILSEAPEIDLKNGRVGIYGKLRMLDVSLHEHDRIEIYRPLIADPKETRRRRAAKK